MNLDKIFCILSNRKMRIEAKRNIIEKCGISSTTASNWLSGRSVPPKIYHPVLAEIFGIAVEVLFN